MHLVYMPDFISILTRYICIFAIFFISKHTFIAYHDTLSGKSQI